MTIGDPGAWRDDNAYDSNHLTLFTYPGSGTYNDIVNLGPVTLGMTVGGYPASVIEPQYHQNHGPDFNGTDVFVFAGTSPETGVFGNLTATITGMELVVGPTLFSPYAVTLAWNNNDQCHSPGTIKLMVRWQSGNAPGSPVTFTPSTPGVGYSWSPSTITLSGSPTTGNTEVGTAVLTIPTGVTMGTVVPVDVINNGGVVPVSPGSFTSWSCRKPRLAASS